MKFNVAYIFGLWIAIFPLFTNDTSMAQSASHNKTSIDTTKYLDEGLSFSTAVIMIETSEQKGLNAEYKWIKEHYPNCKLKKQTLNINNDKPYDIITILQTDGKELKLYFNIASFYGKFS